MFKVRGNNLNIFTRYGTLDTTGKTYYAAPYQVRRMLVAKNEA